MTVRTALDIDDDDPFGFNQIDTTTPKPKEDPFTEKSPFDAIATRPPSSSPKPTSSPDDKPVAHKSVYGQSPLFYSLYPLYYPKTGKYCGNMMRQFRYTCQPSKSLRLDLVEFCKEYSQLCNVPNTHRLPGPGGYWRPGMTQGSTGNIGVNGNFGFGIGSVPGLEVNAGWGVGVGPLPGLENMDNIGVGLNYNLGLLGAASQPEKFRRGMDKSSDAKGGLVGVSGGVGVDAPGSGPIGIGTGVGVGRKR